MGIGGVISAEDIRSLVEQSLVQNNRTLTLIQAKKAREEATKTDWDDIREGFSSFKSSLESMRESSMFYSASVTSSDDDIVTAVAGDNAGSMTYDLSNIILAQAAQKISASTLNLDAATNSYYESTGSILDNSNLGLTEDFTAHDDWTEIQRMGTITDVFFDGRNTVELTGLNSVRDHAGVVRGVDPSKIVNPYSMTVDTYFETLGPTATGDYSDDSFRISMDHADFQVDVRFSQQGVYYEDSFESFSDLGISVEEDVWTEWTVEVDPTAKTFNILKDGLEVASDIDASTNGAIDAAGTLTLRQGFQTQVNKTYIDNFELMPQNIVGQGFVNENRMLDASEGATNITGAITDGSFEINGQTINVDISKDTLMEVLSKINGSSTGVTATWIEDEDKIRLTVDEGGPETITFGATDSSGFLDAMNINTAAVTETGTENAWNRELDQVTALSAVSDGYFNINNITFDVDTSVDSLQDILNEINASQAGVTAYYENNLDKIVMTSTETGEDIVFGNDTSDFLSTVFGNLTTATATSGSVDVNGQTITLEGSELEIGDLKFSIKSASVEGATVTVGKDTETAKAGIENFIEKFNSLRDLIDEKDRANLKNDRLLRNVENKLRTYILGDITNPGTYGFLRDVGIQYKKGKLSLNSSDLDDAFRLHPDSVGQLFGFDTNSDGTRDDGGLVNVMKFDFLDNITRRTAGDISDRQKLVESKIDKADKDITKYEKVIENKRQRLLKQYGRFAEQVNAMNSQFQTFQAQLQSLNQLTQNLYGSTGGF